MRYLDSLVAFGRARGDSGLVMVAALRAASVRSFRSSQFDRAESDARAWLPAAKVARDTLSLCIAMRTIGYCDLMRERHASARAAYDAMLTLARRARLRTMEAYALIGGSYLDLEAGRIARAERGYRRALVLLAPTAEVIAQRTARAGLARSLLAGGLYEEARREYAHVLAEAASAGDLRNQADALNDLGSLEFAYGDPSHAIPLFRRAAGIHRRLGRTLFALNTERNIGLCLGALGRLEEAAALYDSVATAAAAAGLRGIEGEALARLASLQLAAGRPDAAGASLARTLAHLDSISIDLRTDVSSAAVALDLVRGDCDAARRRAREALATLDAHSSLTARLRLRSTAANVALQCGAAAEALGLMREELVLMRRMDAAAHVGLIDAHARIGAAYRALGRRDSAIAHYGLAASVLERERARPSDPEWRAAYEEASSHIYAPYAQLLLSPASGGTTASRVAATYEMLQRFRARTFEDDLRGATGRASPPRATLRQLQRALHPDEVLLDVFLSADSTLVFAVTARGIEADWAPGTRALLPRLGRFRDLLLAERTDPETIDRAATALGEDLLGPLAARVRAARTVLISAGRLGTFPLGRLRVPGESALLAASHRVALVPSATLLVASRASALPDARGPALLALARTTDDDGGALPGVAREAAWLARRFPSARVRVHDGRRSLDEVLAGLGPCEVLHVSAHTRRAPGAPWSDGLLLGAGDGEDAWLTASRIARLRVPAKVCVLAGCGSAGGTGRTEGLPELAGAWLAAGARSVIATLWDVPDRATSGFVEHLYRELQSGATVGDAVASAQSAARAAGVGSPEARAADAFVVVGDPSLRVRLAGAPR